MTNAARKISTRVLSVFARRRRIGIAIGPDMLYVVPMSDSNQNRSTPWIARLQTNLAQAPGQAAEAIGSALAACPHLAAGASDLLHIVVLPPLALARRVPLPRLTQTEYRKIIARDSARYFATDRAPRVVGVLPFQRKQASPASVFAASASAQLVDAIVKTVSDFGCELASLDCAYASWTGAARDLWPSLGKSRSAVVVCEAEVTEVIYSEGPRPEMVRRLSAKASIDQILGALGMYAPSGPVRSVGVIASTERFNALATPLSDAGVSVMPATPESTIDPGSIAATYAAVGTGPGLYPERMYVASRDTSARQARWIALSAAAMLVLAAVVLLAGNRTQLRKVVTQREAIRTQVAHALAMQSDIGSIDARSSAIASLAATTPSWSAILATVTDALPADAYLTSLQAHADTVVLEGVASRAAGVFEALQRAPGITAVHANAPVRQQLQDGTPVEHFSVAARLSPPARTP